MKILVSGNAGAGKSTLGRTLAKKHNLPLYGLDKLVWKEGWVQVPKKERDQKIQKIIDKDSWVIEGVTKLGLANADTIYFLDIPVHKCAINIIKRFLKNGMGTRPELPKNCPEYVGFLKALKLSFIFPKITKPWLIDESSRRADARFVRITSYKQLAELTE